MTSGMEPEVKRYLKKVLNSLMAGLFWLIANATAGIYFGLAITDHGISLENILFYLGLAVSLGILLWYYYHTWSK